jgi:hypothetical protein
VGWLGAAGLGHGEWEGDGHSHQE